MKRIIALILALVFVGMLASCGGEVVVTPPTTLPSTTAGGVDNDDNPNVPDTPPDPDLPACRP